MSGSGERPRIKVLPGYPEGPACGGWVCLGFFAAVPGICIFVLSSLSGLHYALVAYGVPLALAALAVVARYASVGGHALALLCLAGGAMLAVGASHWFWPRGLGPEYLMYIMSAGIGLVMLTGLCLLAAWAAGLILRGVFVGRVVRQTGGLCWTCAYPRAGLAEDGVCPECGTGVGQEPKGSLTDGLLWLVRRPSVWTIVALGVVGVIGGFALWGRHELATYRQLMAMGALPQTFSTALSDREPWTTWRPAGFVPDEDRAGHGWYLVVRDLAPRTSIEVQYGPDPFSPSSSVSYGVAAYAPLPHEHVVQVLADGWPAGMLDVVREQYDAAQARAPANAPWAVPMIELDVSAYFSPGP